MTVIDMQVVRSTLSCISGFSLICSPCFIFPAEKGEVLLSDIYSLKVQQIARIKYPNAWKAIVQTQPRSGHWHSYGMKNWFIY